MRKIDLFAGLLGLFIGEATENLSFIEGIPILIIVSFVGLFWYNRIPE